MMNAKEAKQKTVKRLQKYIEYEINEAILRGSSTTKVIAKAADLQFLVELGYKFETISPSYCRISW